MKHKIYTLVIMLATIVFVSQSCKKEESVMENQESNNSELLGAQGGGEDNTEAKIVEFFRRMNIVREDPNYAEGENWNYSKDSTVWYIEAALNYKYSYNWKYSGNEDHADLYNIDSSYTETAVSSNGEFNIVAIQNSYDALADKLEEQYSNVSAESKFFVLSDIINLGNENGNMALMQYSVIGIANKVFTNGDWKWGLGLGDCSGNHLGLDATDIIENKLSSHRYIQANTGYVNVAYLANSNNGWIVPDDVPLPSGQTNPTPFWNNLIFNYTNQYGNPCLADNDMNWYKSNILGVEQSNSPINKEPIFTDVIFDYTSTTGSSDLIRHNINTRYAEKYFFNHNAPIE